MGRKYVFVNLGTYKLQLTPLQFLELHTRIINMTLRSFEFHVIFTEYNSGIYFRDAELEYLIILQHRKLSCCREIVLDRMQRIREDFK